MTVFTVDVASFQRGLSVKQIKAAGFVGMMARCSIGKNYDSEYQRFLKEAKALDFPFAAYHFLKGKNHTPIATQVSICLMAIKDLSVPLMLDVESDINSIPSWTDVTECERMISAQGKDCNSIYLPHWYWSQIGKPDVNLPLIASAYGHNPAGKASAIYPGDWAWPQSYGGRLPILWQFGSRGYIDGYSSLTGDSGLVDVNAYRGPAAGLITNNLMTGWGVVPKTQEETDMAPYILFDK